MEITWSDYQKAIFKDVEDGKGSTIIQALAGTGKTYSLIESLKYLPKNSSWLLAAFNKKIAEELKNRVWGGSTKSGPGEIATLHSLGLRSLSKTYKVTVDNEKVDTIFNLVFKNKKIDKESKYALTRGVSLAKSYLAHTFDEIDEVLDEHDIVPDGIERKEFINHILFALNICKKKPSLVDFDDMIWLNCVLKTETPKFDHIFLDEGQDFTAAMAEFCFKFRKPVSRYFIYLDENQMLYQFRGSDAKVVSRFQETLQAKILPLSISYRCPKAVIREAQKLVPSIEAAPNAIEGKVQDIMYSEMLKLAKPGCFILSRVNAPLIGLALGFLKQGIPCNIQGRNIGENLTGLIRKSKCKTIDKFLIYLEKWQKQETVRLLARNKDAGQIKDRAECLFALAEGCSSVAELKSTIDKLFSDEDDTKKIILSSIHQAKGLQRDTVFVLNYTLRYTDHAERCCAYVAKTRAVKEMYLVGSKKQEKEKNKEMVKEGKT